MNYHIAKYTNGQRLIIAGLSLDQAIAIAEQYGASNGFDLYQVF